MANQITQNLIDNATRAQVAYGTLKSDMTPDKIMEELTATGWLDDVKFSKAEAMAFAGIEEKTDDSGNTFYDFQTDENENRTNGHTVLVSSQEMGIGYLTGFDAVILQDNATGEKSFNIAGTLLSFGVRLRLIRDGIIARKEN